MEFPVTPAQRDDKDKKSFTGGRRSIQRRRKTQKAWDCAG
jgi:hypothetical protein